MRLWVRFSNHTIEQPYLAEREKRFLREGTGVAGIVITVLLTIEFALRLTIVMVAKHSLGLGLLTVLLVAAFGAWFWLLNGKAPRRG